MDKKPGMLLKKYDDYLNKIKSQTKFLKLISLTLSLKVQNPLELINIVCLSARNVVYQN